MNQKHLLLIPFLFLLFVSSCNQKSKKNIALIIDDKEIYVEQIDKLIEEPLTRILEGIYILRQGAINEYIDNFVLKVEAEKKRNQYRKFITRRSYK